MLVKSVGHAGLAVRVRGRLAAGMIPSVDPAPEVHEVEVRAAQAALGATISVETSALYVVAALAQIWPAVRDAFLNLRLAEPTAHDILLSHVAARSTANVAGGLSAPPETGELQFAELTEPHRLQLLDHCSRVHAAAQEWARDIVATARLDEIRPVINERLHAPVPRPRQVFAIGVNYRDHAAEAGIDPPAEPMVFTKFPSAITGPYATIPLPHGSVDFEAELVAVIGRAAYQVPESAAWSHVAGLTIGQDLSERETQLRPPAPQQYNLGKSYPGFAPLGPCLVTPDEFADPDDLAIGCSLNGEQMQKARTSEFVFTIGQLVSSLSHVVALFPGDVIFTGTPGGIGWTRNPKRLIGPDDELTTVIEGIGQMRHRFIPAASTHPQKGPGNV